MADFREHNAIIVSVYIGFEDHGLLTCFLDLEMGEASRQAFGGFNIAAREPLGRTLQPNYVGDYLIRLLEVLGKNSIDQLAGMAVRVREDPSTGKLAAIAHIIRDDWFYPAERLAEMHRTRERYMDKTDDQIDTSDIPEATAEDFKRMKVVPPQPKKDT